MLFLLTQRKIVFGLFLTLALGTVFVSTLRRPAEQSITSIPNVNAEHAIGHTGNVRGWAWANTPQSCPDPDNPACTGVLESRDQGLGWISFSSENCDAVAPFNEVDPAPPAPVGCPPSGAAIPFYGVHLDSQSGVLSGYAWIGEESPVDAGSVGWISFNTSNLNGCPGGSINGPAGTPCQAWVDKNVTPHIFHGWAKSCTLSATNDAEKTSCTGTGPDGWIALSCQNAGNAGEDICGTSDFGITVDPTLPPTVGNISGWGWGSDILGWVSFACSGNGICDTSAPGSPTTDAFNPIPRSLNSSLDVQDSDDYCQETISTNGVDMVTFNWVSGEQAPQFVVQVGTTAAFSTIIWTSPATTSRSYTTPRSTIFGPSGGSGYTNLCGAATCTYYWRVSHNGGTDWSESASFTLSGHDWPLVRFTRDKLNVEINESVTFTDTSTCYDGGAHACSNTAGDTFAWTFEDGTIILPSTSTSKDPTVQFGEPTNDAKEIVHAVDDGHAHTCTQNSQIIVGTLIPGWKEITP